MVPLPEQLIMDLREPSAFVERQLAEDLQRGAGWVWLPSALAGKYPQVGRSPGRRRAGRPFADRGCRCRLRSAPPVEVLTPESQAGEQPTGGVLLLRTAGVTAEHEQRL
jgi:hypothetical protein